MPDDTRTTIATTQGRDLAALPLLEAIEAYTPQIADALPPHISVAHFKRVAMTAISINARLAGADRRSLFNALIRCASDGLLPDDREAHLEVYRSKIKDQEGRERWVESVAYIPMTAGIRKRMRNSGDVLSAEAHVVYKHDHFRYRLGDAGFIEHEPPPLDDDRGDAVGAYAIIELAHGKPIREVMSRKEIERIRMTFSRAKDGPAWTKSWDEMARKTALRRAAKQVPQAAMLERLLGREDELLPPVERLPQIPPRPRREEFVDTETGELIEDAPDIDGLPSHVMTREPPAEEEAGGADDPMGPYDDGSTSTAAPTASSAEPPATGEAETAAISPALAELLMHLAACKSPRECDALALRQGRIINALSQADKTEWTQRYLARKEQLQGAR